MTLTNNKMILTIKIMILTNHKMILTVLKMILTNGTMIMTNMTMMEYVACVYEGVMRLETEVFIF